MTSAAAPNGITIREATDEDWSAIWPFFSVIAEAGETYAFPEPLTSDAARALWMQQRPGATFVAVDGAQILGTAKVIPNQAGRGSHVANGSFMVNPAMAGRGVGRALATHAVEWARAAGYRSMQFNSVVETNTAAVALWKSLGFQVLATVPEAFDHPVHGLVGIHVMHKRL
ncbi:GNAT family N-acetyltransferase [Plantibacter sp. YIM 135249]|uniref:GNAT family N-acetyltransferase n=1 Tax=Plantibacter sp. YIM 135249 TaxID=3423918 RepID=UPI003D327EEE